MSNFPHNAACEIGLAGQSFWLLPGGGLYWPDRQQLFVADAHLGKEASFRRGGIPVPRGCTGGTLESIAQMIHQTGARRLCVLGDLFHDAASLTEDVCRSVDAFLKRHEKVEMTLVRGNHDRRVGRLPKSWPIVEVEEGMRIGKVVLGHHPIESRDSGEPYLCGHVHPGFRVQTRRESLGTFPCFWLSGGCLVLPAVGKFTGMHRIKPAAGDQIWTLVGDRVIHHGHRSHQPSTRS